MKRLLCVLLAAALLAASLCACCLHKEGPAATCTRPQKCEKCGEVLEKATGHTPGDPATCTEDQTCTVCGAVIEKAHGHTMPEHFDCGSGAVCTVCGEQLLAPCEHTPGVSNLCVDDLVCTVCGAVIEKAHGHTPGAAATATSPQVCTVCGVVLKKATGAPKEPTPIVEESLNSGHYQAGKSYYNGGGNVLCCGNYLMEYFSLSRSGNANYAAAITAFAQKYPDINVCSMIVPKCCSFQSPADRTDQFDNHKAHIEATYAMMQGVTTVDAFGEMAKHRGEYLFYRTDHHWTSLGAYYASVAFCNALGFTPRPLSSYEKVINTDFWGTLYSTYWGSNKPGGIAVDYTVGHLPNTAYTFRYSNDGAATAGSITGTAINQGAKTYASMFICGDKPFTDIVTENKNGRRLLVFKESYGNAFVPYMIDYFEEIIVIDIRSSNASIAGIIAQYGITDALIEHNAQALNGQLNAYLKPRLES